MKQSVRLGRVAGIPVSTHWSVLVILALIAEILGASVLPGAIPHQPARAYWIMAIAGALLFVASLLAIAAAGVTEITRTVTTEDLRRALLAALSHGAAREEGPTQPQPLASPGWR